MLKAVSNIKLNSGTDNSSRNIYKKVSMNHLIRENDYHDSLDISRGYKILKEYGLQIRRFKKNETGHLEIVFDYDLIEFSTKMNLDDMSNYLSMDYLIHYLKPQPEFEIGLHTRTFFSEYVNSVIKTNDINFLMDRVKSLRVESEMNVSNTRALTNLLDNIYNGVLAEFRQINSILTSAAKNIFNLAVIKSVSEDTHNEIVIVEKILPDHGSN